MGVLQGSNAKLKVPGLAPEGAATQPVLEEVTGAQPELSTGLLAPAMSESHLNVKSSHTI